MNYLSFIYNILRLLDIATWNFAKEQEQEQEQEQEFTNELVEQEQVRTYVPPPRVRDAERFWPYMRCKNLAKEIFKKEHYKQLRSHHALIEAIAKRYNKTVEELKNTSPRDLIVNDKVQLDTYKRNTLIGIVCGQNRRRMCPSFYMSYQNSYW